MKMWLFMLQETKAGGTGKDPITILRVVRVISSYAFMNLAYTSDSPACPLQCQGNLRSVHTCSKFCCVLPQRSWNSMAPSAWESVLVYNRMDKIGEANWLLAPAVVAWRIRDCAAGHQLAASRPHKEAESHRSTGGQCPGVGGPR